MQNNNLLSILLKKNRGKLGVTYGLSLGEQLLALLMPLAIGEAINGLLGHDYVPMGLFIGLWLLLAAMTIFRKMYDTRVFMGIFSTIVIQVIKQQRAVGTATSKLVARFWT